MFIHGMRRRGGALHGLGGAPCSVCRASVIVEPQMLNTGVSPSSGWWRWGVLRDWQPLFVFFLCSLGLWFHIPPTSFHCWGWQLFLLYKEKVPRRNFSRVLASFWLAWLCLLSDNFKTDKSPHLSSDLEGQMSSWTRDTERSNETWRAEVEMEGKTSLEAMKPPRWHLRCLLCLRQMMSLSQASYLTVPRTSAKCRVFAGGLAAFFTCLLSVNTSVICVIHSTCIRAMVWLIDPDARAHKCRRKCHFSSVGGNAEIKFLPRTSITQWMIRVPEKSQKLDYCWWW